MTNYPGAIWRPGPAFKVNGGVNRCDGVVCHSMVGSYQAALGELDKPDRRASWHYSVLKDGRVFAHYTDEAQTWHAGSAHNNFTIGIEHEGGYSPQDEPLTRAQLTASVNLVRWLSQHHGFPLMRHVGLWEHNEVSGAPTACPSHRIPWAAYPEEEDVKSFLCWSGRVIFVGPSGPRWIASQATVNELGRVFGGLDANGNPTMALSGATIMALGGVPA